LKMWKRNLLIICIVLILLVVPFVLISNSTFSGTDVKANETIAEINPSFKPWLKPLFKPLSQEMETFLFALQAAIGAGVLGFCFGRLSVKKIKVKSNEQN